jgi:hypothetical protein
VIVNGFLGRVSPYSYIFGYNIKKFFGNMLLVKLKFA